MDRQLYINLIKGELRHMGRLFAEIEKVAKPYYDLNDPAHQWDHAVEVMAKALNIRSKMNIDVKEGDVIAAALLHDIAVHKGRDLHHVWGSDILSSEELKGWFRKLTIDFNLSFVQILYAILEHRASYTEAYTYELSRVIAVADRIQPDPDKLARRMAQAFDTFEIAYNHMQHKFGRNGYVRNPQMFIDYYGPDVIEQFQVEIDDVSKMEALYNKHKENVL